MHEYHQNTHDTHTHTRIQCGPLSADADRLYSVTGSVCGAPDVCVRVCGCVIIGICLGTFPCNGIIYTNIIFDRRMVTRFYNYGVFLY